MYSVLYYIFTLAFLIVYGVFISLVWLLTVLFDKKRSIISLTTYFHAWSVFIFSPCWKIKIEGRENIKRDRAYVVVSNHQAMLDIPLICLLKMNMRWVAKRELIKMPFVGHAMLIHGDILLERGAAKSARHMMERSLAELNKGVSVAIFPEGTRSKSGRVERFKEGAFSIAKRAEAEVLPVAIEGTSSAVKGWKLVKPHTFSIRVLPPIDAETVKDTGIKELTSMVHDTILEAHRGLRPDLYEK